MRWIPFIILLYVGAVVQTTIAPVVEIRTIRPDLLMILAVYYALHAQRYDALLACWCVGFLIDLTSIGYASHSNVGIHAVAMGLAGILIVGLRDYTIQDSPFTQMIYCFLMKLFVTSVMVLHMAYILDVEGVTFRFLAIGFWEAVYTGLLAPYAFWALRRMRAALGLGPTHRLRMG
ncbi:MAG TPA: rod shape-determining protein MreD [Phycisphaerae bacterium]|nr:rod shape-determining protein MreD [Phycisphaerae bacterium]HRW53874.1 rod shape-determining protein MreD [Phycisphaerae bacterium]